MPHRYRIKAAWLSYLGIQIFWGLCVLLIPVALGLYPSKLWALPLSLVTVANGLHLTFFRHEYNALLRKTVHLIPYARYVTPPQRDPKYFLPFGLAYTLFGIVSAVLVIIY